MILGEDPSKGDKAIIPMTPIHLAPGIMLDIGVLCDVDTIFSLKQTSAAWCDIMNEECIWKKFVDKPLVFDGKPEDMTYKTYAQVIHENFLYDEFSRFIYHSAMEKRFIRAFLNRARLTVYVGERRFEYVHRYFIDTGCLPYLKDIYESVYYYNTLVKTHGPKIMRTEDLSKYFKAWYGEDVRFQNHSDIPYRGIGSLDYPDHISSCHFWVSEHLLRGILVGDRRFFAIRFWEVETEKPYSVVLFERYSRDSRLAFGKRHSALNIRTGVFSVNMSAPELLMFKKLLVFGKANYLKKCSERGIYIETVYKI